MGGLLRNGEGLCSPPGTFSKAEENGAVSVWETGLELEEKKDTGGGNLFIPILHFIFTRILYFIFRLN